MMAVSKEQWIQLLLLGGQEGWPRAQRRDEQTENISVRVQSRSAKIESDPVLFCKIFENHKSIPVLIRQYKTTYFYFSAWGKSNPKLKLRTRTQNLKPKPKPQTSNLKPKTMSNPQPGGCIQPSKYFIIEYVQYNENLSSIW